MATAPCSSGGGVPSGPIHVEFRCQYLLLEQLPLWLASKSRAFGEGNQSLLSVVHYKGFGQTMDIRARPPPENMLSMMRAADVLVFDGDNFEVADSDGICVNFVCALPIVCGFADPSQQPAPALLAFKLEDEEAIFLDSWQKSRCVIGIDKVPFKISADAPDWSPHRVIDITYVLIPRSVCSPSYRGGVLCSAAAAHTLPTSRSHIFASILDDAKKLSSWVDSANPNPPHLVPDGAAAQAFAPGEECPQEVAVANENAHATAAAALHFACVNEAALHPNSKVFVALGTLATVATAAVDHCLVDLKRRVVVWGGGDIVACELAAQKALYMPTFSETLPWHYFHAVRTRKVGDEVQYQEGVLNTVQCSGFHCHT
jgi:hypothetical protein